MKYTNINISKIINALLFSCIFIAPAFANEVDSYLCIAEKATGFSYYKNSDSWNSTNFKLNDVKFLLLKNSKGWEWRNFGSTYGTQCVGEANGDFLRCDLFGNHTMSRKSLRFMQSYMVGYVDGINSDSNTPSITIGKCTPL